MTKNLDLKTIIKDFEKNNKDEDKIKVDLVIRKYYNNGSRFFISSSGKTNKEGKSCSFVDSYHVIISYYLGEWKFTIPMYIILNDKAINNQIDNDEDMIHFFHSTEYPKIINGSLSINKYQIKNDKIITINPQERNFVTNNTLEKTVFRGKSDYIAKIKLKQEFQAKVEQEKKAKNLDHKVVINKNLQTDFLSLLEEAGVSEEDYWYMDLKGEKVKIKVVQGKEREKLVSMDFTYKQIIILRKLMQIDTKKIVLDDSNIHDKMKSIEEACNKYMKPVQKKIKESLDDF